MTVAERLIEWADKIDSRIGPISGRDADMLAAELREAARAILNAHAATGIVIRLT